MMFCLMRAKVSSFFDWQMKQKYLSYLYGENVITLLLWTLQYAYDWCTKIKLWFDDSLLQSLYISRRRVYQATWRTKKIRRNRWCEGAFSALWRKRVSFKSERAWTRKRRGSKVQGLFWDSIEKDSTTLQRTWLWHFHHNSFCESAQELCRNQWGW